MTRARVIAATIVIAMLGIAAPAFGQVPPLVFQPVSGTKSPEVTLEVTLPAELLKDGTDPRFTVTENGVAAKVLGVERIADDAQRTSAQVVLLLDASGSMKGRPLDDAKVAAHKFIDAMGANDRIALIAFAWSPTVLADFTSDRTTLSAAIDGVKASGETAVNDAVVRATELAAAAPDAPTTIVLLSDGGDTVSINSLASASTAVQSRGTPVYVVALESKEYDPQTLAGLASASGGRLLSAQASGELSAIYAGIAKELTNRYRVTFKSAAPNTADLELDVAARVGDVESTGSSVIANPRYGATGPPETGSRRIAVRRDPLVMAIVVVASFLCVGLLGLVVLDVAFPQRVSLNRLEFYDQTGEPHEPSGHATSIRERLVDAVGYVAGRGGVTRALQEKLQRAGVALRPAEYIYFHLIAVVAAGLLTRLLTGSIALAVLMIVVATAGPLLALEAAAARRVRTFEEQLPDILNMLSGSLRAGWSISQAISLVVEQMPPPASTEFMRVQTEVRLGLSVEEALRKMADRLGSEDFNWTVSAITIQRDVGGNLAEVLDIVANTMRERAELRRHIHSLTAEGRLSGIILMSLPFVELVALLVVNPEYMSNLLTTPMGVMMSVAGVVLLLIGFFWLRRALSVEV